MIQNKKLISQATWLLVVIGALNWGILGLGTLVEQPNLNIVHMLLGDSAVLEAVVYLFVGMAGARVLFKGHLCSECK